MFMVNIVSTLVVKEKATFPNLSWFFILFLFIFLINGLFHHISDSKSVLQIFAVVESSYILVQSSPGCHYWSIPLQ